MAWSILTLRHGACAAVLGLAFVIITPARACPPPPLPPPQASGESDEAYRARLAAIEEAERERAREAMRKRQASLWDVSPSIFVGRIERVRQIRMPYSGSAQAVLIRPVRWFRGGGGSRAFWLRYQGETDCGPYGGGDAVAGKVSEHFVVFARAGRLKSDRIEDSVGRSNAIEPRISNALSSTSAPPTLK